MVMDRNTVTQFQIDDICPQLLNNSTRFMPLNIIPGLCSSVHMEIAATDA